jgi:hypothetical protein
MAGPPFRYGGQQPYTYGYGGHRRRRGAVAIARRMPFPLWLLVGVVGVGFVLMMIATMFSMAVLAGVIAVPVLIVRSVQRSRSVRRRQYYYRQPFAGPVRGPVLAPPSPRPIMRPVAVDPWRQAKGRFAALRSEYAAYECDALAVLRLPALADVTVPSTARFVEAFAEAQALDVDNPPQQPHRDRYIAAVELAWSCWRAAREAAERLRLSHLPADERSTIERVVRLLTAARDTDNDAERLVAYTKARSELARLERSGHIRIPKPAQAALDNAYRGQLPA